LWTDGKALWAYVDNLAWNGKPLIVVGHNVFFDLTVSGFFSWYTKEDWVRTFWYDKGLTYIFCIAKGRAAIKCISSTNYFPASLHEMGKAVSLEKYTVDPLTADDDTLSIYCFRDTEILVNYILRYVAFVTDQDLGAFRLTRASQAMAAYRHRFKPIEIYFHAEDDVRELECSAYYGGRTEAFQLGEVKGGPFVSLDVNSMYPYVMQKEKVPVKLRDVTDNPPLSRVPSYLSRFLCVAEVDLETDEPIYAVRHDGKIVFPIGRFSTFVCTHALREAWKRNHLRRVKRIALYDGAVIFSDFVDYFYRMRIDAKHVGDKLTDTFAKYCLNSLYGKFGQFLSDEEIWPTDDGEPYFRYEIFDATTGVRETRVVLMNMESAISGKRYSDNSFYAIPAHVTEAARMILWRLIEQAGYNRVLYCDTDSIKLRKTDLQRITYPMDQNRLGALKVEKEARKLAIYGLKDYREDDTVHIKGIPRQAVQVSPHVYRFTGWPRQSTHLRAKAIDYYITVDMQRELKRIYHKGTVDSKGRVHPLVFGQG